MINMFNDYEKSVHIDSDMEMVSHTFKYVRYSLNYIVIYRA